MTTTVTFCDLPDRIRLALRDAIEDAGGYGAGYLGPYVQVALPSPAGPFFQAMEDVGLELDENSLHYFPLGSDAPPDHLRHQRGYWLYGNFSPGPSFRAPVVDSPPEPADRVLTYIGRKGRERGTWKQTPWMFD
jgi:hypothetical protein